MAGIHGPGRREKSRSRGLSRTILAAVVVLVALVAGGIAVAIHLGSTASVPRVPSVSIKVVNEQAIGVANPGPQASGGSATLLYAGSANLLFTPSSGGETVQPSQQWQADQVAGGGYVLIFTPDGLCLSADGSGTRATAELDQCQTVARQRWYHPYLGTDSNGRSYWQLRSAANGRCLAVGGAGTGVLQPCSRQMSWQQSITFWSAF